MQSNLRPARHKPTPAHPPHLSKTAIPDNCSTHTIQRCRRCKERTLRRVPPPRHLGARALPPRCALVLRLSPVLVSPAALSLRRRPQVGRALVAQGRLVPGGSRGRDGALIIAELIPNPPFKSQCAGAAVPVVAAVRPARGATCRAAAVADGKSQAHGKAYRVLAGAAGVAWPGAPPVKSWPPRAGAGRTCAPGAYCARGPATRQCAA
jgi:hypothetical protein